MNKFQKHVRSMALTIIWAKSQSHMTYKQARIKAIIMVKKLWAKHSWMRGGKV